MPDPDRLAASIRTRLLERNAVSSAFFAREAPGLAKACRAMAERFLAGGRLLAFGRGAYATDAQHVSVEFVHPVIMGKRALPALDLSPAFDAWLDAIGTREDIVMGFGPPEGDTAVQAALARARARGAMTIALPGPGHVRPRGGSGGEQRSHDRESPVAAVASAHEDALPARADGVREGGGPAGDGTSPAADALAVPAPSPDPFVHQELLEILYHTLWETVHVFFEHRELGHDPGASGFLYPFLGEAKQDTSGVVADVAVSIEGKAREVEMLRERVAEEAARSLARAAIALAEVADAGGALLALGNGGSATDANDFVLDCVAPPARSGRIAAISLAMESPNVSAVANDIGPDEIFLRLLIAQARPNDAVVAFSTSGSSRNIVSALEEARRRGLATVAFLGYDGGEVVRRNLADTALVVPSDHIPRIQEVHASLYHELVTAVREARRG